MLKSLHSGHPGISSMVSRAELTIYWPGIVQDIKKFVSSCNTCQKYQDNKLKMVLQYKKVPMLPWQEVGFDIFEFNQKYYLVVVDALSNYTEVGSLKDLRSTSVIQQVKIIFSRNGVPVILFTDGGLCFDSALFKAFEKEWGFLHIMSSPHQRSTPRGKVNSPASILMGRQLRTNIPCSFATLVPKLTYIKDRKIMRSL